MTNDNKLYLKFPINTQCEMLDFKDYVRYLWFKKIDRQGIVLFSQMRSEKYTNHNWMRALVKRGWAIKTPIGYQLISYQAVWRSMGINRVKKTATGREFFKYLRLPCWIKSYTTKDFFNYCVKYIREEMARIKRQHLTYRLLTGKHYQTNLKNAAQVKHNLFVIGAFEKPVFTTKAAAKLYGYKSASSGRKLLLKYFSLSLDHDTIPRKVLRQDDNGYGPRYTPFHIHLNCKP